MEQEKLSLVRPIIQSTVLASNVGSDVTPKAQPDQLASHHKARSSPAFDLGQQDLGRTTFF
jgi:hypothetical protein